MPAGSSPDAAAAFLAKSLFAREIGVSAESVAVAEMAETMWSSSALGCPKPDQMYAQVMTPGYRIVVTNGQETATYHADQGAEGKVPTVIRCDHPAEAGSAALGGPSVGKAMDDLRQRLAGDPAIELTQSRIAPVAQLVCEETTPAPPDAPKKVVLEFHLKADGTTYVYRAWGLDVLYCGEEGALPTD